VHHVGVSPSAVLVGLELAGLSERSAHLVVENNDEVVGLEWLHVHLRLVRGLVRE
jgi:hypothetical protein